MRARRRAGHQPLRGRVALGGGLAAQALLTGAVRVGMAPALPDLLRVAGNVVLLERVEIHLINPFPLNVTGEGEQAVQAAALQRQEANLLRDGLPRVEIRRVEHGADVLERKAQLAKEQKLAARDSDASS